MANTIITHRGHTARINYWRLQAAFETLADMLPADDAARRVFMPWLAHINEELGFVDLDVERLNDREAVARLRDALVTLATGLSKGTVALPKRVAEQPTTSLVASVGDACTHMANFLDGVAAEAN